jgi:sulfur-carrier protein adenylyltransferase/sulfurtransferase
MDARYARQVALPGWGAGSQARLAAARVLVIGAGGLGSTVIPALAGAGVGRLTIVDDDHVEASNLHRQTIHAGRLGQSKAESAAALAAALGVEAVALPERLTADTALELFAHHDLVLDGSDNFPTRYLANDAAELTGIPLVWGAVSQYGGQAGISWDGVGYRDLFPVPPPPGSVPSCAVGGVMPTTVAVIGSIMAGEALKLLTGVGQPLLRRVTTYDALTGAFRELPYARDPEAEPITGLIDYDLFCGIAPLGDEVDPAEVAGREDVLLLDVREPWEAELVSLPGSQLMPLGSLDPAALDATRPVVVVCHHGIRSRQARDRLRAAGIDATSLRGGIDAWAAELDPGMTRY